MEVKYEKRTVEIEEPVYIAEDGEKFYTEEDCKNHETRLLLKRTIPFAERMRIRKLDGKVPLTDDGVTVNENIFRWYRVENKRDFSILNEAYKNRLESPTTYPEIICVETTGHEAYTGDAYVYRMESLKYSTKYFWKQLGYDIVLNPTNTIRPDFVYAASVRPLLHEIAFEKSHYNGIGVASLYFKAPVEILNDDYPGTNTLWLRIDCQRSYLDEPNACCYSRVLFSPSKGSETYDWFEVNLPGADVQELINLALKANGISTHGNRKIARYYQDYDVLKRQLRYRTYDILNDSIGQYNDGDYSVDITLRVHDGNWNIDYDIYKVTDPKKYLDGGLVCDVLHMPDSDIEFWSLIERRFEEHVGWQETRQEK